MLKINKNINIKFIQIINYVMSHVTHIRGLDMWTTKNSVKKLKN